MRCETPKNDGNESCSDPLRDRAVLLEISALSSISITTVTISPRAPARRSPRSDRRPAFHSEADSWSSTETGSIGKGADVIAMIEVAPLLTLLVLILLSIHALVTFTLGSLFRLSLPELITASNAAVLGATTAPALAATRGWNNLVTPGVLVGVLGYALGTFIGTAMFKAWGG